MIHDELSLSNFVLVSGEKGWEKHPYTNTELYLESMASFWVFIEPLSRLRLGSHSATVDSMGWAAAIRACAHASRWSRALVAWHALKIHFLGHFF